MKPLISLGASIVAATAAVFGWRALHRPATSAPAVPRVEPSGRPSPAPPQLPRLTRDLLRYAEPSPAPVVAAPPPRVRLEPEAAPATPPPARLLGFVRRSGSLNAALLLPGNATVVTLVPGESDAGYTLVAVDEEQGALVRLPDGNEVWLPPGP